MFDDCLCGCSLNCAHYISAAYNFHLEDNSSGHFINIDIVSQKNKPHKVSWHYSNQRPHILMKYN